VQVMRIDHLMTPVGDCGSDSPAVKEIFPSDGLLQALGQGAFPAAMKAMRIEERV
jgi:hypothetical protein